MDQLSQKACSKCGETKPLDEFYRDSRTGDGHRSDCKACVKKRKAPYDAAHREERLAYLGRWRAANRERAQEQRRGYREANRDKLHEANRAYRDAHREDLREQERQRRDDFRLKVFAHYGQACACCGATDNLTIDHIGGGGSQHRLEVLGRAKVAGWVFYRWLVKNNFPDGFQVLCFPCNQSKHVTSECRLNHD